MHTKEFSGGYRNKSLCRLSVRLFLVSLAVLIPMFFSFVATCFFPANFIAGYGRIKAQVDYAEKDNTYNRVLITGDSLAQVSYMPPELSKDTYNYGIGNLTPVDGYYRLIDYLDHHPKPQFLFCSFNPTEFFSQGHIWKTPIQMHNMSLDMASEIIKDAKNYDASAEIYREDWRRQLLLSYYGLSPNCVIQATKGLIHDLFVENCYDEYLSICNWIVAHKGHWKHYMAGRSGSDIYTGIANESCTSFPVTEMTDAYMKKIADLCEELDIQLIYETIPFNESTYDRTEPAFIASYKAYWERFQEEYPHVIVNSEITYYDNQYFGDCFHFNSAGTEKYTQYIREKYAYIFDEETQT